MEDISEAVLKVTQNGEVDTLEGNMLKSFSNCSQLPKDFIGPLGLKTFTGMFIISGTISTFVFFSTLGRFVVDNQDWIWNLIQSNLIVNRTGRWMALLLQIRVIYRYHGVELTPTANQATA